MLDKLRPIAALLTGALTCAPHCTPPVSPAEARHDQASRLPRAQCDESEPGERSARVLGAPGLLRAEPLLATVHELKFAAATRLVGARIRYAAPPGVTPAWFHREIECHQADVVLGRAPASTSDPYSSPEEWLHFEVAMVDSNLVVTVRAATQRAAEGVLDRARRLSQPVQTP